MRHTISNVTCTVCGCVCDDLSVVVDGDRITSVVNGCRLADPWFPAQTAARPAACRIGDNAVTLEAAYAEATKILAAAKYPLIYGLSRSTTEGQRAATALADTIGATIDTTASTGHAPSIMAFQQVGESTCTLGEVKQRADLVIFWGSDPLVTHPRHRERYCPPKPGRFIVVVDHEETESAKAADLFIRIEPDRDWEAFWELRLMLAGKSTAKRADLQGLVERMKSCRFGIVFFGMGITQGPLAHRTVESLLQLVTDLNDHTRFYARRMRRYGDVAGADSVLTWQTGYPFGVNFSAGYPRYNPGEFTGPDLLARKEADACLLVGSETANDLPQAARDHLRTIPTIVLDSPGNICPVPATVTFITAVYGIHRPGTGYRMDEVPIPLRVLVPTDYPSDGEVLTELCQRLAASGVASTR